MYNLWWTKPCDWQLHYRTIIFTHFTSKSINKKPSVLSYVISTDSTTICQYLAKPIWMPTPYPFYLTDILNAAAVCEKLVVHV